jgi:hypothetical protein
MLIGQEVGHSLRIEANLQLLRHHRQTVRPHRRPISARRKVRSAPPSWRSVTASSVSATIRPVVEFVAHHPAVPTFDGGMGRSMNVARLPMGTARKRRSTVCVRRTTSFTTPPEDTPGRGGGQKTGGVDQTVLKSSAERLTAATFSLKWAKFCMSELTTSTPWART